MKKFSTEATLKLLLQGFWKGIQEAKKDSLVQEKYPKGLSFIENFVVDLGKKAKNPNFSLTEKQVRKLNQFLGGSSGVLSPIIRRHIVKHCKGNQCAMVSPNEFRFQYVAPTKTFQISGELEWIGVSQGETATKKIAIPTKSYEKLSDFLNEIADDYHSLAYKRVKKNKSVDSSWEEMFVDGDRVLFEAELEWDYDYFQTSQKSKVYLTIYVNGNQVKDQKLLSQASSFYKKKWRTM